MTAKTWEDSAYWKRSASDGQLYRACPWRDSRDWLAQFQRALPCLESLRSPLLLVPGSGARLARDALRILENGWQSVPAERVCERWTAIQIDRIMLDVARAVELLNGAGLLAVNLNPTCVLIDGAGEQPRAALADFFSCALREGEDSARMAHLNMRAYAAPEVRESRALYLPAPTNLSADVYSLGVMYHAFLTGRLPEYAHTRAVGDDAEIPEGRAKLSRKLDQAHRKLISRMLDPDPERRISSAAAAVRGIDLILRSGNCRVRLGWPGHEGEVLTLSCAGEFISRQRIDETGSACFGPLLSVYSYELRRGAQHLASVAFPFAGRDQALELSVDELLGGRPGDAGRAKRRAQPIRLDPPVNYICKVEPLSEGYCLLTMINGGAFRIRTADAAQFGLANILNSTGR